MKTITKLQEIVSHEIVTIKCDVCGKDCTKHNDTCPICGRDFCPGDGWGKKSLCYSRKKDKKLSDIISTTMHTGRPCRYCMDIVNEYFPEIKNLEDNIITSANTIHLLKKEWGKKSINNGVKNDVS